MLSAKKEGEPCFSVSALTLIGCHVLSFHQQRHSPRRSPVRGSKPQKLHGQTSTYCDVSAIHFVYHSVLPNTKDVDLITAVLFDAVYDL